MPDSRHRRSIRLYGYDYAQPGAYFITVCTHEKQPLFGECLSHAVHLNPFGRVVDTLWRRTAARRELLTLDAFVVMPNHVHAVLFIVARPAEGVTGAVVPYEPVQLEVGDTLDLGRLVTLESGSLGAIVGNLKSIVTRRIHDMQHDRRAPLWQRNYYERIVRDDDELAYIRAYIAANPARWAEDRFNELCVF